MLLKKSNQIWWRYLLVVVIMTWLSNQLFWRPCSEADSSRRNDTEVALFIYKFPPEINAGLYQSGTSQLTEHSVEYWLYHALTAPSEEQGNLKVRVVQEADEADIFYIPSFLGLHSTCWDAVLKGLELYPGQSAECPTKEHLLSYEDRVLEFLEVQPMFRRNGGFDHVLPCIHPFAGLQTLRQSMPNAIFLAVDFMLANGSLDKDIIVPYTHMVPSMPYTQEIYDPAFPGSIYAPRKWLVSFRGGRWTGDLRKKVLGGFENFTDLVSIVDTSAAPNSHEDRVRLNAEDMRNSKFCFHIGGDTSSSARLFDAIVNLCIPVMISPNLELPFEAFVDYNSFVVHVSLELGQDAPRLVEHLMSFEEEQLIVMRRQLAEIRELFEFDRPFHERSGVNMILQEIKIRAPLVALKIKRWRRGLPLTLG